MSGVTLAGLAGWLARQYTVSMQANTTARDAEILAIARKHLHLSALDTRHSDGADFREHAVWSIKSALEAAYAAGRASAGQT